VKRLAILVALAGCTAAQKTDGKIAAVCTAAGADKIIAIMSDKATNGAEKLLLLSATVEPDVAACVLKATQKPAALQK